MIYDIIKYLKADHHRRGGVEEADNPDPERYGAEDTGVYLYNNEGIADLLYTNNFLLMNLWETWKAVNKEEYYSYYTKRSEEHTSELQSRGHLVCRLLLEKKKKKIQLAAKGQGAKQWNNSRKTTLTLLPKKPFSSTTSRNVRIEMLDTTSVSTKDISNPPH